MSQIVFHRATPIEGLFTSKKVHVSTHVGIIGNEEVDRLAKSGVYKDPVPEGG